MEMETVDRILSVMREKKMKEQDICRILHTHKSKVYDWKKGRSRPTADEIAVIAKYFGVSSDYLLGMDSPPNMHSVVINPYGGARRELKLTEDQYKAVDSLLENLLKKTR
ncbi:MAG: helix-turn-helix domain-containing protein [Clostridiales bacterium]|nr:helix-turn-helix domain-containing protein [Clostridiales bacterium]